MIGKKLIATVVMPEDDEEFEREFDTQAEVDAYVMGLGDASSRFYVSKVIPGYVVIDADFTVEKETQQLKDAN